MMELWELPIWDSARKRGIPDADIRHALRNLVSEQPDPADDDVVLYLGADFAGNLIEVGVLTTEPAVIHAMPARLHRFPNPGG